MWLQEVAKTLAAEFNPQGYRVPTRSLPDWLVRLLAPFDATVRLIVPRLGHRELVSSEKAVEQLGWSRRPLQQTLLDTATSMIEHGLVPDLRSADAAAKPR